MHEMETSALNEQKKDMIQLKSLETAGQSWYKEPTCVKRSNYNNLLRGILNMNIKATLFSAATAVALRAFSVSAATVLTVGAEGSGSDVDAVVQPDKTLSLGFPTSALSNDDYTLDQAFNLRD